MHKDIKLKKLELELKNSQHDVKKNFLILFINRVFF